MERDLLFPLLFTRTSPVPRGKRRLPLPPPVRRKARGIWNQLERSWAVDREIARLERSQGPFDIVEMPNWGAEGLCYCFRPRAPLVIRLSTPLAQVSKLKGQQSGRMGLRLACFLESLPVRRGSGIIAHSQFIARYCVELYRVAGTVSFVIPLGMEYQAPPPTVLERDERAATILYVGRLERRKGIERLLHAIPEVMRSAPHCRFVIAGADIGEAPLGKATKNISRALQHQKRAGQQIFWATLKKGLFLNFMRIAISS